MHRKFLDDTQETVNNGCPWQVVRSGREINFFLYSHSHFLEFYYGRVLFFQF